MACRICERLKRIRLVDLAAVAFICVFMYIINHFEMKKYREQKAQEAKAQREEKRAQDSELKAYEQLQKQCFFKQDKHACEALKAY